MFLVLVQSPATHETRKVLAAAMLSADIKVIASTLEQLSAHQSLLQDGALPVGSVAFVRAAMALAGIAEPENMTFAPAARKYRMRSVQLRPAGEVLGRWFVKPREAKLFTGFVFDSLENPETLCPHLQEQHAAFLALPAAALVWVAEPVEWLAEWRFYVSNGEIIGAGRYDPEGAENAPNPEQEEVHACIRDLALDHPYALDFGVLATGDTALVEVNDAWALGLYGNALSPQAYHAFLQARWMSLFAGKRHAKLGQEKPSETSQFQREESLCD